MIESRRLLMSHGQVALFLSLATYDADCTVVLVSLPNDDQILLPVRLIRVCASKPLHRFLLQFWTTFVLMPKDLPYDDPRGKFKWCMTKPFGGQF